MSVSYLRATSAQKPINHRLPCRDVERAGNDGVQQIASVQRIQAVANLSDVRSLGELVVSD
jgi:hypothetical protein